MAAGFIEGGVVGAAIAKLLDSVIDAVETAAQFRSNLLKIAGTLARIQPIFDDVEKTNMLLDRPEAETGMLMAQVREGEALVRKCQKIKPYNLLKAYRHSCKLLDLDTSLLRFFQIDVQAHQLRDIKEVLVTVKYMQDKMGRSSLKSPFTSTFSGSCSAPLPPDVCVGLSKCEDLKLMVTNDDISVAVVSAPGGYGKTTLVKMLCHDNAIKGKFGNKIFFVTVSRTPNLKAIVNNLFQHITGGQQQPGFQNDGDAVNQLGSLMNNLRADNILLVLDDVWSESLIDKFRFHIRGYKVLVTSRFVFERFSTYVLEPLSNHDATTLFCRSAFPAGENFSVPADLVEKMIKHCKNYPLALSVIGSLLYKKHVAFWKSMLEKLSEGKSILDLDEDLILCLKSSFEALDEMSIIRECFLDFGLFPKDRRIVATAFIDMWAELYNLTGDMDAFTNILELSFRNLITFVPSSSSAVFDYCEGLFVTQHDMLRELAIHLSGQEPIVQRKRLIVEVHGKDIPKSLAQVQEPIHARFLSISTDETFSSRWHDWQLPDVEVAMFHLRSRTYAIPEFLEKTNRLKVLTVTNHGIYPTNLQNFSRLGYLSDLRRIRLESISISSMSRSSFKLVNLKKISLIHCQIAKAFENCSIEITNVFPSLEEIEIDYCSDLKKMPEALCNGISLKRVSITNCHELVSLPEKFGRLKNLEILRLHSCTKLARLPESVGSLKHLSILDITDCFNMRTLPERIGDLCGLRVIHMKGCAGIRELPPSVKHLNELEVLCDEEVSYLWNDYCNVRINLVEEDKLRSFGRIIFMNGKF